MKTFSHFHEELKEFIDSDATNQRLVPGPVNQGPTYELGGNTDSRGMSVTGIRRDYEKIGEIEDHEYYLSYKGAPRASTRYAAVINKNDNTLDFQWTLPGADSMGFHSSLSLVFMND